MSSPIPKSKHWHLWVGTDESRPQVDFIMKDGPGSITAYIDLCQQFFHDDFKELDRPGIEKTLLEACRQDTDQCAIMRSYVYMILWIPCDGCKPYSLN